MKLLYNNDRFSLPKIFQLEISQMIDIKGSLSHARNIQNCRNSIEIAVSFWLHLPFKRKIQIFSKCFAAPTIESC